MHATSFASHSSISFAFEAIEQLFLHNFFLFYLVLTFLILGSWSNIFANILS